MLPRHAGHAEKLEVALGRKVDIVTRKYIKNPYILGGLKLEEIITYAVSGADGINEERFSSARRKMLLSNLPLT